MKNIKQQASLLTILILISTNIMANNNSARVGFVNDNIPPISDKTINAMGTEGFEDVGNLSNWLMDNQSIPVGSSGWFQGNDSVFLAQSGGDTSYIAANFNNTSGTDICNWLILPDLGYLQTLRFWTRTTTNATFPDRLFLLHSPTGGINTGDCINGFGDFTESLIEVNSGLSSDTYPESWTEFDTNINSTGRVAFVYYVNDTNNNGNYIGIDNIQWLSGLPEADLSISINSDITQNHNVGDDVTFTTTVTNNGPQDASSTGVNIQISDGLSLVSNTCLAQVNGSSLTWGIGDLSNGSSVNCQVIATLSEYGNQIFQSSVNATEVDLDLSNNNSQISINLAITAITSIPTLSFYGLLFLISTLVFLVYRQRMI